MLRYDYIANVSDHAGDSAAILLAWLHPPSEQPHALCGQIGNDQPAMGVGQQENG